MAGYSKNMSRMSNPADQLTDELLVEILSLVPYKSLCRFKCVSRCWRDIISHPGHRKVLPQYHLGVLAGFLHCSYDSSVRRGIHYFSSVSVGGRPAIDPALTFLPNRDRFDIMDSCNGLLLCRCFKTTDSASFNYAVCNPATEKAVFLPGWFDKEAHARLGFEPDVSSHFHVFQFLDDPNDHTAYPSVIGVDIYSSKTGVWIHKDSRWDADSTINGSLKSVFFSGVLCLVALELVVLTVDVEGNTWRMIPVPEDDAPFHLEGCGFIDLSQGCLHFANTEHDGTIPRLSIWVLEDFSSEVWILKHTVRCINLFGVKNVQYETDYTIVAIHPEGNTVFIVYGSDKILMSYEMDSGKVCFIHTVGPPTLDTYLPYVPLYLESLADGQ